MAERDESRLWLILAAVTLVSCAAAVRFGALHHSLFEDEVWLADLLKRGGLRPHTWNVPPLFYVIGRLWTAVRGTSDTALREPAALFGVVLCAMPFLTRLPVWTRFSWSALLAFSSPLIYYSERLKQYTLEACAGTLLIVLFLRASRDDTRANWTWFFAAAAVAVLTLHTPVFVLVSIGAVLLVTPQIRRLSLIAGLVVIGLLSVAAYFGYMSPGSETAHLHGDMNAWFTVTGRWVDSPASFIANTKHWLGQAMNLTPGWWLVAALLCAFWLIRQHDYATVMLAAIPPLIALVASTVHFYPYGEVRLMIYCFPGLYLAISRALDHAAQKTPWTLLLLVPFAVRGVAAEPYEHTYMKTPDLHPMYAMIAHTSGPVYADPSYAAPLLYYDPALQSRMHVVTMTQPAGPGWYVQKTFNVRGDVTFEEDGVVATHLP